MSSGRAGESFCTLVLAGRWASKAFSVPLDHGHRLSNQAKSWHWLSVLSLYRLCGRGWLTIRILFALADSVSTVDRICGCMHRIACPGRSHCRIHGTGGGLEYGLFCAHGSHCRPSGTKHTGPFPTRSYPPSAGHVRHRSEIGGSSLPRSLQVLMYRRHPKLCFLLVQR